MTRGRPAAVVAWRAIRRHQWPEGYMVQMADGSGANGLFVGRDCRGGKRDALLGRIAEYWLGDGRTPSITRTPVGAPRLMADDRETEAAISVSHVDGRLVVALAAGGALGIDAETRGRIAASATCRDRWLSPAERRYCARSGDPVVALACRWVLKEALGKALGSGLPPDPAAWSFTVGTRIKWYGRIPARAEFLLGCVDDLLIGMARFPRGAASA